MILAYFGMTALLVSMSRYRIPTVPFLLVLLGGTLVRRTGDGGWRRTALISAAGLAALGVMWMLNLSEVCEAVSRVW